MQWFHLIQWLPTFLAEAASKFGIPITTTGMITGPTLGLFINDVTQVEGWGLALL